MPRYIKYLEAEGVLGRFDIYQEFQEGVNVLFGKNGTGKTTLLHILANLLNGDYKRFAFLEFSKIKVQLDDETNIVISKNTKEKDIYINVTSDGDYLTENLSTKEILEQEPSREEIFSSSAKISSFWQQIFSRKRNEEDITPILPVAYFPAFRTMIEAWASSVQYTENPEDTQVLSTNFARKLFGYFVPNLNYPSLIEIEHKLTIEIKEALFKIAVADRENFSNLVPSIFQVLSKNFHSLENTVSLEEEYEEYENMLEEINSLVRKLEDYPLKETPTITQIRTSVADFQVDDQYKRIAHKVLKIYREALEKVITVQEDSFRGIEKYLNSVNSFLEGKKIESLPENTLERKLPVGIKFDEGTPKTISGISHALSSGEREIVTLIYAATYMSKQQIVLIDEPEISLHVVWQRHLLQKMSEQLGDRQIIVCTHSPVIGADYEERVIIFEPKITCSSKTTIEHQLVDEDNEVF